MKGLRQEDLENQDLITELRKAYGMIYNDFYVVLTDVDMKRKVNKHITHDLMLVNWDD